MYDQAMESKKALVANDSHHWTQAGQSLRPKYEIGMHTELDRRMMRRGANSKSDIPMIASATPTRPTMSGINGVSVLDSGGRFDPGISMFTS